MSSAEELAKRLHDVWQNGYNKHSAAAWRNAFFDDMLPEAKHGWLAVAEEVAADRRYSGGRSDDCIWCGHPALSHTASSVAKLGMRCVLGCNCTVFESLADIKQNLNLLLQSFNTVDIDTPIAKQGASLIREYRAIITQLTSDLADAEIIRDARPTLPISMRLACEKCGELHIDTGEFATKPHHTHACQHCGLVWRPALVATVGVEFLPGFRNETP